MIKTGTIIKLSPENYRVLETHSEERKDYMHLVDIAAAKSRKSEESFWNTMYGLFPGLEKFDIRVDYKKKEITVRGKKC